MRTTLSNIMVLLGAGVLISACGDDAGSGSGTEAGGLSSGSDGGTTPSMTSAASTSANPGTSDDGVDDGSTSSTPPPPPPPPPPPGIDCAEPFNYQGLDGCVATVEGIQIKFFPLAEGETVEHLAIYFHGDTAPGWYDNWAFPEIVGWAEPRNILTLGVLSPMIGGSGLPEFGEAQPPDAEAVALAIETFADAYNAPREEIFYWSTSGGSWFFTSSYIPVAGGRLPGWFAISCGASGFSYPWSWDNTDAMLRDRVSMFLNYGTEDFLAGFAEESYVEYQGLGFEIERLIHDGATHCAHPINQPTIDFWSQFTD
ncbi:MAG: hypothetical protein K0V04_35915 [Deltaproteobacteria bacterium]|nr:hypothetical protein [Deltaproteobacteria bacterium]